MHLISTLLFAISANIDNFSVSIAYGIKEIKIGKWSNILIAVISGIGTFLSMSIGLFITKLVSARIANILGCTILITLGVWFIINYFISTNKKKVIKLNEIKNNPMIYKEILDNPEKADKDNSGSIDTKESVTLAFALTINNFGLGIGASITGLNVLLTTCCTIFFSIIAILLGYLIGNSCLSKLLGKYAPLVSGIIIVSLGIYELFI